MKAPSFIVAWALVSAIAPVAASDWMGECSARIFQRVYAQAGEACPAGLDRVGDTSEVACARYAGGFDRLKKTLKLYDDKPNPVVTQEIESDSELPPSYHSSKIFSFHRTWHTQGSLHFRDWLEDDQLVVIALDEASGLLAVLPKDSCLDPGERARTDLYFEGGPEFIAAEALDDSLPPPPSRSSGGAAKGGDAVVQFIVDRKGAIRDACVLHSRPGGFGKRALKAIKHWEFVPATLEDRPVDSVVSIAFRWRQSRWDYERSARPLRID